MTASAQPHILAEVGGVADAEHGPLVVVVDRGTGPLATVAFVLGVMALVFGVFGGSARSSCSSASASPVLALASSAGSGAHAPDH